MLTHDILSKVVLNFTNEKKHSVREEGLNSYVEWEERIKSLGI